MTDNLKNPQAFPQAQLAGENAPVDLAECGGMTLRDYFAAQALPAVIDAYIRCNGHVIGTAHILTNAPIIAFQFADAMLAERQK